VEFVPNDVKSGRKLRPFPSCDILQVRAMNRISVDSVLIGVEQTWYGPWDEGELPAQFIAS
jgi:hypothetical protein